MISPPEFPTHQALKEPKMGMCKPRKNWDMGISWEDNGGNRKSPRHRFLNQEKSDLCLQTFRLSSPETSTPIDAGSKVER